MEEIQMTKKDVTFAAGAGLLIGLLLMPTLAAAKPDLYAKLSLWLIPFFLVATPFGLTITYYISKKIAVFWQLGKFIVTGVLNVLVDMGVLSLLIYFFRTSLQIEAKDLVFAGLAFLTFYSVYKAISFIIANINSYIWNKYWTFGQTGEKKTEFLQFFLVSLVGFFINVAVASLVFHLGNPTGDLAQGQWGLIGAAMGSIVGLAWNFIGYKFFVFKK
ncbi:MAG: GtrA family protein [Candidatus Moranbacteria bacterium]|nr:GtrA family protein [Candidatus Moranbacteria bacterium]